MESIARGHLECPHRPPCAGCPRFGHTGVAPAALHVLNEIARHHGLPPVVVTSGESFGFRHRARLAIRGRLGSPKLGLFELGTHRVVHVPRCRVHHPLINKATSVVRQALVDAAVTSYSDRAHLGCARYLQVVIERSSQSAQLVLVANSATVAPLAECLELIRERLGSELHSLWFNSHVDRSNTVLGNEFTRWCGPESVVERFGGAAIHYPPGAFGQSNLEIASEMIEYVRGQIPQDADVTEFYAGVGAFGLSMLSPIRAIRLNEISEQSLRGLELGLAELAPQDRTKVTVVRGSAGASLDAMRNADVVIADPPRKGLEPALVQFLREHPPKIFLYVSCGLDSFVADAMRLTDPLPLTDPLCLTDPLRLTPEGPLRLTSLVAFNLLPFTAHVETVARFER